MIQRFLQHIGQNFLALCEGTGRFSMFVGVALSCCLRYPWYLRNLLRQMLDIGFYSLPVVGLTALFSGMVLALQSYSGFARFSAEGAIASVVALSVTRELGPVLAGLMVAGRVGAAMAAEIGTMRVTEQIDALSTLSTNPYKYLIVPRLFAATLMLPCLVLIADIIGIFGGFIIGVYQLEFNAGNYIKNTLDILEPLDVISGLVKAAAFGMIIALAGCYNGFHSKGGAQGVGRATTNAVVGASILILIANFLITAAFFGTDS
jgi:phospholipid/cholesterol/gamma-HCH transport system permease protein